MFAAPVTSQAQDLVSTEQTAPNSDQHAFTFTAPDGTRTFDTEDSLIVPNLLPGDELSIDGSVINVHNSEGTLVASIKADLPEDLILEETEEGVIATSANGTSFRCIGNKWVSLGINVAADALVCAPFGVATGGVGGFGCGAAVATGVTAASC